MVNIQSIAVVIATKNRTEALRRYALPSLEKSAYQNFICLVWDASDNDDTQTLIEQSVTQNFQIYYHRAQRAGLTSQRNDAVKYIIEHYSDVKYIVFIDDDSELSTDALDGVVESFSTNSDVVIVNIPMYPVNDVDVYKHANSVRAMLGLKRHRVTAFMGNYGYLCEPHEIDIEWAGGGGMAVNIDVFNNMEVFFPEEFQHFGGYALAEDFAFSYFVFKKMSGRLINSVKGHFLHYAFGEARLDVKKWSASRWYNYNLLFEALHNNDLGAMQYLWFKALFCLYMCFVSIKMSMRQIFSGDFHAATDVFRGVLVARKALSEYYKNNDINTLMRQNIKS